MFKMFREFSRKKTDVQPKKLTKRSFVGAVNSLNNRFNTSFNKINGELKSDYIALTLRARALAKNN
jgi:hypothetical protein